MVISGTDRGAVCSLILKADCISLRGKWSCMPTGNAEQGHTHTKKIGVPCVLLLVCVDTFKFTGLWHLEKGNFSLHGL